MCGIAGLVHWEGSSVSPETVRRMIETTRHRGPDDTGLWLEKNVGLGHNRLSIIDLSPRGHQPMSDHTDRYRIVFNGEIYNFPELRTRLQNEGHHFQSSTDTEVIIALYDKYGVNCLQRMEGMWAFAIYDRQQETLFCARDRFGKKPFYYYHDPHLFAFASQPKALRALPTTNPNIDATSLGYYLTYGYIPEPHSIWQRIAKLPHGHYLKFSCKKRGTITPLPYWNTHDLLSPDIQRSVGETDKQLRHHLYTAVERRLIADVPIGAFLSGGIDSSAIVAAMRQKKFGQGELHTFSIGFDRPQFDETHYANQVAQALGTQHHVKRLDARQALAILHKLPEFYDEPFADSSMIPTYAVSELARQYVTVVLSGDGGDELWGGYLNYIMYNYLTRIKQLLPFSLSSLARPLARFVSQLLRPADYNPGLALGLLGLQQLDRPDSQIFAWLSGLYAPANNPLYGFFKSYFQEKSWADNLMQTYMNTHLVDDFLVKVDRASMAHGLEVRCPFLDQDFVRFALTVPADQKINVKGIRFELKGTLRRALRGLLPREVLTRGKQGFSLPMAHYLIHEWRGFANQHIENLLDRDILPLPRKNIQAIINDHHAHVADYSQFLYALVYLDLWLEYWEV